MVAFSLKKSTQFAALILAIALSSSPVLAQVSPGRPIVARLTDNGGAAKDSHGPSEDPNLLIQGRTNFSNYCLKCHDAAKSMSVAQDYEGWLKTVDEMSRKEDASIPQATHKSIATYLALLAGLDQVTSASSGNANAEAKSKNSKVSEAEISLGRSEFNSRCTSCHDAEKSTSKSKSLVDWQATVQRMAGKQGANVPSSSVLPISAYLASLSSSSEKGSESSKLQTPSSVTVSGTISPTFRGGDPNIQNSGLFPDAWLGINWDSGKQLSGRITACVTCHTPGDGQGDRFEFVEAALRYDLSNCFGKCKAHDTKAAVEAGRFIVPFGAFSSQSNPGVYRTVSRPLIYNMGQRVHDGDLGDPVLPMPYADEGANLSFSRNITPGLRAGLNSYVVNGLQSDMNGINFDMSRDYVAINSHSTVGSRATLETKFLRFGGSVLTGQSSPSGGFQDLSDPFYYKVYGYDATLNVPGRFRFQFEYARRSSDRGSTAAPLFRTRDRVSGYYAESEYHFQSFKRVSFLTRYDNQDRRSLFAPDESSTGLSTFGVHRFTYGLNLNLNKAGLVMINHEHWSMPKELGKLDLVGVRWVYTF